MLDDLRRVFSKETQHSHSTYDTWSHQTPTPARMPRTSQLPERQQGTAASSGNHHDEGGVRAAGTFSSDSQQNQFPIMEINRMKKKARKLRYSRSGHADMMDDFRATTPSPFSSLSNSHTHAHNNNNNDSSSVMSSERDMALAMRKARLEHQQAQQHQRQRQTQPTRRNNHSQREWQDDLQSQQESSLGDVLGSVQTASTGAPGSLRTSSAAQSIQEQVVRGMHSGRSRSSRSSSRNILATPSPTKYHHPSPQYHATPDTYATSGTHSSRSASTTPTTQGDNTTVDVTSTDDNSEGIHDHSSGAVGSDKSDDWTLHELCGEAHDTEDVAWRNALYLLGTHPHLARVVDAQGWTPLHVCCLGSTPPPYYMVTALLQVCPQACTAKDGGDRNVLHLASASSADAELLRMLIRACPTALHARDALGWTPLQLLIKNTQIPLTVERVQLLSGYDYYYDIDQHQATTQHQRQSSSSRKSALNHTLLRRGEHLSMSLDDISEWQSAQEVPTTTTLNEVDPEEWSEYPPDVQMTLRKLAQTMTKTKGEVCPPFDDFAGSTDVVNPTLQPSPTTLELPLHMVFWREWNDTQRQQLRTNNQNASSATTPVSQDSNDDEDEERPSSPMSLTPKTASTIPDFVGVLRCLVVTGGPEALAWQSSDGKTPLWLALGKHTDDGDRNHAQAQTQPVLEIVELLLGQRHTLETSLPIWARDMAWHRLDHATAAAGNDTQFVNPATLLCDGQLPLHWVVQEWPHDISLCRSIRDAYPGAIHAPDAYTGSTPLHLALATLHYPAPPELVQLVYHDRTATVRNRLDQTPLDVMLMSSSLMPRKPKTEAVDVYQRLLVMALSEETTQDSSSSSLSKSSSSSSGLRNLRDLSRLPVWLREMACNSPTVQKMIREALAGPVKFAWAMLDGVLLIVLVTVFRIQLQEFAQQQQQQVATMTTNAPMMAAEVPSLKIWYTLVVYACACGRLLQQAIIGVLSAQVGQLSGVVGNVYFWLDLLAMILSVLTSVFFYGGNLTSQQLFQVGTATTGLLWLALVGYAAKWCHGMAVFTGILSKIANHILWPLLAIVALLVGAAQMFYTLLQENCTGSMVSPVCSVRDSYRVVYLLLMGESMVDIQGEMTMSNGAIVLVALFWVLLVVFFLSLLVTVMVAARQFDFDDVSVHAYWQPKLAFLLSTEELGCWNCRMQAIEAVFDRWNTWAERNWDLMVVGVIDEKKVSEKHWEYHKQRSCLQSVLRIMISIIFVPLWLLLGLVSFGILWPPQVRRAILRPRTLRRKALNTSNTDQQLLALRGQVSQLKEMSYSRTGDLATDIQELKELLYMAMKED